MACVTALAQLGLGTPRPTVQRAVPLTPARVPAARMRIRASSVSAEQASKRAPFSSMPKRRAKGVITGRGAAMSKTRVKLGGAARRSLASIAALASGLSEMAVIDT